MRLHDSLIYVPVGGACLAPRLISFSAVKTEELLPLIFRTLRLLVRSWRPDVVRPLQVFGSGPVSMVTSKQLETFGCFSCFQLHLTTETEEQIYSGTVFAAGQQNRT